VVRRQGFEPRTRWLRAGRLCPFLSGPIRALFALSRKRFALPIVTVGVGPFRSIACHLRRISVTAR
jgi:hypothetical protein